MTKQKERYCKNCKLYYVTGEKCPKCKSKFRIRWIEDNEDKKKKKEPIPVLIYIVVIFLLGLSFRINGAGSIFIGIIALICGSKCYRWACEIKSRKILAYFIGFLFGLIGLLGYYIYYKIKKKNCL